ncbi:MAG: hypothetical protein ABJC87_13140 [Roseobacter sp.]
MSDVKSITSTIATGAVVAAFCLLSGTAAASDKTCSERMPEIKTKIDEMPDGKDKVVAEKQFGKVQQFFASGRERNCLLYLEAIRSNIDSGSFVGE